MLPPRLGAGTLTHSVDPLQLTLSANSRYILAGGQPWFMHGLAAWSVMSLNATERTTFLDDCQSKGITALIVSIPDYIVSPLANGNGDLPFTGTVSGVEDFSTPNESYWNFVDSFFNGCRTRRIVVVAVPAYYGFAGTHEGVGVDGVLTLNGATKLTTYGAFLGARYRSFPNIIWCHYADNLPASSERTLVKAIQDGIKSTDVAGRLFTNHYARGSLSTDDTTVPCDVILSYAAGGSTSPRVHKKALDGYAVSPAKPVFLGEDEYDHKASGTLTNLQLRQENWDAWLSGVCGKLYGDEDIWPFTSAWGGGSSWATHLTDQGISELANVRSFLLQRQWWLLVPSQGTGLVTSGGGTVDTDTYKPRALASDGSWGAVYCVDGTTVTIDLSLFRGTVTARWYDPTNGSYYATTGGPTFANSGTHAFIASSEHGNNAAGATDLVLVLEA